MKEWLMQQSRLKMLLHGATKYSMSQPNIADPHVSMQGAATSRAFATFRHVFCRTLSKSIHLFTG